MGLLTLGTPLEWNESKEYLEYVKAHGVLQLISIYQHAKTQYNCPLLWGDELEYMVVSLDKEDKKIRLSLRQAEILKSLEEDPDSEVVFHPEYGRYMIEATPARPFTGDFVDLTRVEDNMRRRRMLAKAKMHSNEEVIYLASFPMLGVGHDFTDPPYPPNGPASKSLFLPDELINPHVRFPTLTANIRRRRGSKVAINIPIFKDRNTPEHFIDDTIPWDRNLFPKWDAEAKNGAALPDHIYMDSMGFGMGCCCLQVTFQSQDINEARCLYDQLAPLTPIMLALTAASPVFRGYLADRDSRWDVIAMAVDDRTPEERNRIAKSRYDSIDSYLSDQAQRYNDVNLVIDEHIRDQLLDAGFEKPLANHFAHLFIRDPVVIFKETLKQDDEKDSDHFENIQSTNWQTMRFKPPPPGSDIGWRVEFRSMEIQLTDFENAAFAVFIVLVTRAILSYKLSLLIPISKVDENMRAAQERDAIHRKTFWFRQDIQEPQLTGLGTPPESEVSFPDTIMDEGFGDDKLRKMSCDEIINGSSDFVGLVPLVVRYLHAMEMDMGIYCKLSRYISVISERAAGREPTPAAWIRNFILSHPDYQHDSKITSEINFDLITEIIHMESRHK